MSRSQATPEEAEQYYRGPTIQQCRYPTSQDHNSTSSDLIHGQICTTRVYLSGLQTHLQQETSYESLRESPHNTVPDRSDAGTLDTGRTPLLSPDSMSDFQEGTEALPHYPRSGESGDANTAFQYTPNDVLSQAERQSEEGENLESTGSDEDEECNGAKKTKVERLAEKRKMKRFRLTHAQTRYLMGEFARQAHPDANQRERLSRDIPGLSPRQAQVWFQNRRAKLKRLTTDDQERTMRSRVLPEDFDSTHTLRPAYGAQRPSLETVASLSNISLTDGGRGPKLTLRQDDRGFFPINKSSVYSHMPRSGGSTSGSFSLSPVSSLNEGSYDGLQYSTSAYSGTGSPTIASHARDDFSYSSSLSRSVISQGHKDVIQQGSANRFSAKLPLTPVSMSDTIFADSPYSHGGTPSRSSPTPFSPIYKQRSAQYSPAAGSAEHACHPAFYTGYMGINPLQSGQLGRVAQCVQFPRPLDGTVNAIQPPASSNSYSLSQGNIHDGAILGQQRPYTGPDP